MLHVYRNFEIIIINNNSMEEETYLFFDELQKMDNIHIIDLPIEFNYSKLNNIAAKKSKGDYLLFLNNDTEVITNNWIEELVSYAQQAHIGAVGAKLIYPNNTIQHAGVVIGKGAAWHAFYGYPSNFPSNEMLYVTRNCSAVTGACLMVSRKIFEEVDGFDEELDVVYNDVDLCLKIWEKGYYNVWNPNVLLYHYEGATRGKAHPKNNTDYFCKKWYKLLEKGDPFDTAERMKRERLRHSLQNNARKNQRDIYIWGAGSSGYRMYSTINEIEFAIKGFIDSDPAKWDKFLFDLPIFSPTILQSKALKPYVIIASMYSDEIKSELVKMGYEQQKDFWVDHSDF
ncbi:N-glycosyltransferase [[Flavobacterium] thermophilum]|nr:N-glycosyltransferase [[Flavobacterium] thermophilum]